MTALGAVMKRERIKRETVLRRHRVACKYVFEAVDNDAELGTLIRIEAQQSRQTSFDVGEHEYDRANRAYRMRTIADRWEQRMFKWTIAAVAFLGWVLR